ncbi:MAG: metal ABC transporter solute-binding protein, Zn/Mn family [Luteibaculum sp.]
MKITKLVCVSFLIGLFACQSADENSSSKPSIVCTTNIVADLIQQLGGDDFEVVSLMGPGVDPHIYKAKPRDIEKLQNASIVFYNGLHLEGKMSEILENFAKQKPCIALSDGINPDLIIREEAFVGGMDPHFWFDTKLWEEAANYAALTMKKHFPDKGSSIDERLMGFRKELQSLRDELESSVSELPVEKRMLVTAHDAFSYYAREYNFTLLSIQGLSTQSDFSVAVVDSLSNSIVEQKIPCAFFESSISKKSVETLLQVCKQKGMEVREGGILFSDALGNPDSEAGNYIGMLRHNTRQILSCLKQ